MRRLLLVLVACSRQTVAQLDAGIAPPPADVATAAEAAPEPSVQTTAATGFPQATSTVRVQVLAGPRWHCEVPSQGVVVDVYRRTDPERGRMRIDRGSSVHRRWLVAVSHDGPNVYFNFAGYEDGDPKPSGETLRDVGCIRTGNSDWRVPGPPWRFSSSCFGADAGPSGEAMCKDVGP